MILINFAYVLLSFYIIFKWLRRIALIIVKKIEDNEAIKLNIDILTRPIIFKNSLIIPMSICLSVLLLLSTAEFSSKIIASIMLITSFIDWFVRRLYYADLNYEEEHNISSLYNSINGYLFSAVYVYMLRNMDGTFTKIILITIACIINLI